MAGHDGMNFFERAPMDSRHGRMVWIGSKNPHPFNRRFIYLARAANVKTPWLLAFARHVEDSPYWAQKPMQHLWGARHYLADIQNLEKNLPCNVENNLCAGLIVIEAWFRGY